jgi:hypothetical protein
MKGKMCGYTNTKVAAIGATVTAPAHGLIEPTHPVKNEFLERYQLLKHSITGKEQSTGRD